MSLQTWKEFKESLKGKPETTKRGCTACTRIARGITSPRPAKHTCGKTNQEILNLIKAAHYK